MGLHSLGSPIGPYAFPESDFLDMQTQELPLPHTGTPCSMHTAVHCCSPFMHRHCFIVSIHNTFVSIGLRVTIELLYLVSPVNLCLEVVKPHHAAASQPIIPERFSHWATACTAWQLA